jgi:hypothetical protein
LSRPGSAGSDFTVQDSLVHLCSLLPGPPPSLAGVLGYPRTLGLSVILGLAGVAAAAWLFQQPRPRWFRSKHPCARCEPRSHRAASGPQLVERFASLWPRAAWAAAAAQQRCALTLDPGIPASPAGT